MNTRVLLVSALLLAPTAASAQITAPPTPYEQRGFVQLGGGAQSGSHTLANVQTFSIYDEDGTIAGAQEYGGGAIWNIGGGVRVWRQLVVALNYTRNSDSMDTAVIARVPHPLFTNRHREANQRISGLKHNEDAYHVSLQWMIPVGENLTLGVGGGPSFVTVGHDFASSARVQENDGPPNFASVSIQDVELTRGKETGTTVNVGADLTYNLPFELGQTGRIGATLGLRYAGGTVTVPGSGGDVDVKYGGAQFWGGLRLSF